MQPALFLKASGTCLHHAFTPRRFHYLSSEFINLHIHSKTGLAISNQHLSKSPRNRGSFLLSCDDSADQTLASVFLSLELDHYI